MASVAPVPLLAEAIDADRRRREAEASEAAQRAHERSQSSRRSLAEWMPVMPEPRALRGHLDFDAFPYQRGRIAADVTAAREVVVMKSSQVGESAVSIREAVWDAAENGRTVLYIFPAAEHVRAFGIERLDPGLRGSRELWPRLTTNQVELKAFGAAVLHLRGSQSRAGAQSVAAQSIFMDEYSLLDRTNLPQIERRITGAEAEGKPPRVRRFGTPTLPNIGIDLAYEQSDRRFWEVTCSSCGRAQEVTWEGNVRWTTSVQPDRACRPGHDRFANPKDVLRAWRACSGCEEPIDVAGGRWVVRAPESPVVGFHVTRLIVPRTDLGQIVVASRATDPNDVEAFWNLDLGLPFASTEMGLDEGTIRAWMSRGEPMVDGYEGVYATTGGLDVAGARDMNAIIHEQRPDGSRVVLWAGAVHAWDDAELTQYGARARLAGEVTADDLMVRFNLQTLCIDSDPERRAALGMVARWPGRAFLVDISEQTDAIRLPNLGDPGDVTVRVDRTQMLDATFDAIRHGRDRLPLAGPERYVAHLLSPKRRTVLTPKGRRRRVYVSTGMLGDDYALAHGLAAAATQLHSARLAIGQELPEERPVGDAELGLARLGLDVGGWDGGDVYEGGFDGW